MGFMDDLKKLTKPYTEDDDDFDEFDDDEALVPQQLRSGQR